MVKDLLLRNLESLLKLVYAGSYLCNKVGANILFVFLMCCFILRIMLSCHLEILVS